ncbi:MULTISPECIES: hypothetical protein [Methylobacterium]|jgi:hypothetical protein|uniref:Protein of unassigned function n=1 Tax=Methylobacterium oryzae CBMB20 TaxID=693986 RepID=A0A089NNF7_9HYPH|nr:MULTISPECIES: hypothetical protein [Methylobacterium]KOX47851.1 hypothetical protein ADL19_21360 [Streptomyces purpurogeneiscleroticus]AIQ88075.1 protein of unassigned function [Methylobacterium oryzae CBMB20]AWV14213.1 hypothetical protein A3862_00780 [Methylobacterium sp. XJLW]WFS08060.1 hypothetical protein P9K36_01810 [Methylobacterium sp. 391_Methyba4]SFU92886.1 hypothetical protein SAMN02799643_03243 [Methylobacterium sp. UNCCL125]
MRLTLLALSALTIGGLCACSTSDGPDSRSGLAETFNLDNYRASGNTNGTQSRRDVNRAYTQPTLPTIGNRGM